MDRTSLVLKETHRQGDENNKTCDHKSLRFLFNYIFIFGRGRRRGVDSWLDIHFFQFLIAEIPDRHVQDVVPSDEESAVFPWVRHCHPRDLEGARLLWERPRRTARSCSGAEFSPLFITVIICILIIRKKKLKDCLKTSTWNTLSCWAVTDGNRISDIWWECVAYSVKKKKKKKNETELTADVLKKDQKHTKCSTERFLIRQKKKVRLQIFEGILFFEATNDTETNK